LNEGHFYAEAMDWSTGLWFLFDDTTVTYISQGPNHCIEKSYTTKQDVAVSGCKDVYRLNYVKTSILVQVGYNEIKKERRNYLLREGNRWMSTQIMATMKENERYVYVCICFKNSGLHSNILLSKPEKTFLVTY